MLAGVKPPTTNELTDAERVRMLRSVRKLGAVMGTPPLIVDHPRMPLSGRKGAYKREGAIFTVSSSSHSLSSVDSFCGSRCARLSISPESRIAVDAATRLRLVLTLTQPTSDLEDGSSCSAASSTDSLSILTRSLSVLLAAAPDAPSAHAAHAARRRKMLKLVQLLGGPIPTALVFPPSPSSSTTASSSPSTPSTSSGSRHHRRRSRSVPPTESPRKLVRPPPRPPPEAFSAVSLRISRPRPLAPLDPAVAASRRHSRAGTDASGQQRGRRTRSVTPPLDRNTGHKGPYNLRRKSRLASEDM